MREHIPPEEKLLKLIRSGKKANGATPLATQVSAQPQRASQSMPPRLGARRPWFGGLRFEVKVTGRHLLLFAFLITTSFFIYELVYPWVVMSPGMISKETNQPLFDIKNIKTARDIKPLDFYLEDIKQRQIFKMPVQHSLDQPIMNVAEDFLKDISLLGVIFDKDPQAIIEDKKTKKTYYLHKGQWMGDFQIVDIQEGRILLEREGQTFELHL